MITNENSVHMGGYITGIGKIKTTGEIAYNKLSKPIKNVITSAGIDHLLCFNNQPDAYITNGCGACTNILCGNRCQARSGDTSNYSNHYGVLTYCGIGAGAQASSYQDTQLVSQIGDLTSTRQTDPTDGSFNGTSIDSTIFGKYTVKVTYKFESISGNHTVKEVGIFGRYGDTAPYTYPLFARVDLSSNPVEVLDGEGLLITYELSFTLGGNTPTVISDFCGLKDLSGNTLHASKKLLLTKNNGSGWKVGLSAPWITYSGSLDNQCNPSSSNYAQYVHAPIYMAMRKNNGSSELDVLELISTASGGVHTADWSWPTKHTSTVGGTYTAGVNSYKCSGKTSKYRDAWATLGAYFPDMEGNPTGYIDVYRLAWRGYEYIFGYDNNGTWVDQAFRKYANQELTLTYRLRYTTDWTTNEVFDNDPADPA